MRPKTQFAALALAAITLVSSAALAQDAPRRATDPAPPMEYTFGDHRVDGGGSGPEMSGINVRVRTRRETLIRPRLHYVNEMLKSVETL